MPLDRSGRSAAAGSDRNGLLPSLAAFASAGMQVDPKMVAAASRPAIFSWFVVAGSQNPVRPHLGIWQTGICQT